MGEGGGEIGPNNFFFEEEVGGVYLALKKSKFQTRQYLDRNILFQFLL